MIQIDIRPVWRFRAGTDREFDFQLIAILGEIDASSKLGQGAERAGISYRHAWNLIRSWEEFFGAAVALLLVFANHKTGKQLRQREITSGESRGISWKALASDRMGQPHHLPR